MDRIKQALELGQSFWLDYIRRDLVENGELDRLIKAGEIRGVTSNPTIFQQAIGDSELYNGAMRPLAHAGWTANQIYESLAIHDIRTATDLFLPLYEGTGGKDGFVSIEVNPRLADDSEATLEEARKLWATVNRPNLMVKIPATAGGIPAIEQSIYEGINVNVTLIFALERYSEVMEAYLRGLERRLEERLPLDRMASVASFFVSRVDTAVDRELEAFIREEGPHAPRAGALLGSAAVANAKLAYAQFQAVFEDPRFALLRENGARVQRPLWASTSTKNPAYSDVLYVDELIGPDTVNTLPPKTLEAFRDHGTVEPRLEKDLAVTRAQLEALEALGVSMQETTDRLELEGVGAFAKSFDELIETVGERAAAMRAELGPLQPAVAEALQTLDRERVAARYWRKDLSLWPKARESDKEHIAEFGEGLQEVLDQIKPIAKATRGMDISRIAWIGSSWSPELFHPQRGSAESVQIESLDPIEYRKFTSDSMLSVARSKSEQDPITTAIVDSIWRQAEEKLKDQAGDRFVAVAPGDSDLARLARERGFRWVLKNGTVTSLLLQAELAGSYAAEIARVAARMKDDSAPNRQAAANPGLYLGAVLGVAQDRGVGRFGLVADAKLQSVARWLGDRLAVSGLGTRMHVLNRPPAATEHRDRMLIYLRSDGGLDELVGTWIEAGEPVVILETGSEREAIGGEVVRWDMATGVATHLMHCEPLPDRASDQFMKRLAKSMGKHRRKGRLDLPKTTWESEQASVWWSAKDKDRAEASSLDELFSQLLDTFQPGLVVNFGIFRRRTKVIAYRAERLRESLRRHYRVDCRIEFGKIPSTTLSKDGTIRRSFIILEEPASKDQAIPSLQLGYGELQHAGVLAAFEALRKSRQDVCAITLKSPIDAETWLRSFYSAVVG